MIKKYLTLTPFTKSICIGLMLSDGFIGKANNRSINARLQLNQSLAHWDVVYYSFTHLAMYCGSLSYLYVRYRKNKSNLYSLTFRTLSLPAFTDLHNLFYINGHHIIPFDLYHYFNEISLAYWIMGDGAQISRKQGGLILGTDAFTIKEVVYLMNVLLIKYNIESTLKLHDNKPRIYIKGKSMNIVSELVKPYVSFDMLYKIVKPVK